MPREFTESLRFLMVSFAMAQVIAGVPQGSLDPRDPQLDPFYSMLMFDNPAAEQSLLTTRVKWTMWYNAVVKHGSFEAVEYDATTRLYLNMVNENLIGRRIFVFGTGTMRSALRSNIHAWRTARHPAGLDLQMGVGPCEMREGDEVVILGGCRHPLILRKQEEGQYVVVGDAYIPGYMHGEVFEEIATGTKKHADFTLI